MIRFRYKISKDLQPLIQQTIIDWYDIYLYGMMKESDAKVLKSCPLYLVCESEEIRGQRINKNPVAIVARNENQACDMYYNEFKIVGYVMAMLEERCDKIKVEPV